jgi:hypothetical protein
MSNFGEIGWKWQFSIRQLLVLTTVAAILVAARTLIPPFLFVLVLFFGMFAMALPMVLLLMVIASAVCDLVCPYLAPGRHQP